MRISNVPGDAFRQALCKLLTQIIKKQSFRKAPEALFFAKTYFR